MNKELLEANIDRYGLKAVLTAIADICSDKAIHIATNWQDAKTAMVWESASNAITEALEEIEA